MQTHYDAELKDTVRYLGTTLGETIKNQLGQEWLDRIEKIRKGGRASYQGDATCSEELKETFKTMSDSDLLTVGRAFAQFYYSKECQNVGYLEKYPARVIQPSCCRYSMNICEKSFY